MASGPITSWQIDEETMETMADFIFLGSQITVDGDFNHEIKRCLLLERKAMTNLLYFKNRDITLLTKVHIVKVMVFPVVIYRCECWTIKEGWALKNWCFWTVVLETLGEGNGNPLQYSCLENSMDGGGWWAAVHGVAKSRTRLSNFTLLFTFTHWRRKWQPTPAFLPGESQGRGSLLGCRLWGRTESDTTEAT